MKLRLNKNMSEEETAETAYKIFVEKSLVVSEKQLPFVHLIFQKHYKTKKYTIQAVGRELAEHIWRMHIDNAENVEVSMLLRIKK